MVKQQKKNIFKPRARLMLLLGDELIRDTGIAIFELVKNAYDADASFCKVKLININKKNHPSSKIIIEDNGTGMDIDTIRDIWLQPGTENRKKQREKRKRTDKYKRLPLGEKGVGRFAVHKLGRKIKLITRAVNQKEVIVNINWSDFEKAEYLSDVVVDIKERHPKIFHGVKIGTRIEVEDLRELPWEKRRVRSLYRSITSICSPFEESFSDRGHFKSLILMKPDLGWLEDLLRPEKVLSESLFNFKGEIKDNRLIYDYTFYPRFKIDVLSKRVVESRQMIVMGKVEDPETGKEMKKQISLSDYKIGSVKFDFRIFDLEPAVLKLTSTDPAGLKVFLKNNGGVKVYRDGIRVYDFGEPENDWLDLGGKRVNVPASRIGNNQIMGAVFLDLSTSSDLREKTNREGFVENKAYLTFKSAIEFAVEQAQAERNIDKKRIRKFYSRGQKREPVLEDLTLLREEVKKRKLVKPLMPFIDRIEIQYRDVQDRLLVAAGAGLNLAAVMHEVEKGIATLYEAISRGDSQKRLVDLAKRLSDMIDGLNWLTKKSGRVNIKASTLIEQAIINSEFRFRGHNIKITNGITNYKDPDFEIKCSRRLIMAALSNLIDNSIYWLDVKAPLNKLLYIGTTYEINGLPVIVVADNGPGFVDPCEYLIQPFFTRKPDGMGLGLHIADQIMKTQKGRLLFPEVKDITLPKGYGGALIAMEFVKKNE